MAASMPTGYPPIEIETPSGVTLRCEPLTVAQSLPIWELIEQVEERDDPHSLFALCKAFASATGIEDQLDKLYPGEITIVVAHFFARHFAQVGERIGQLTTLKLERSTEAQGA